MSSGYSAKYVAVPFCAALSGPPETIEVSVEVEVVGLPVYDENSGVRLW